MIGNRCHPYQADLVCRGRFDAVMRGAFGWDDNIGGYVCNDLNLRQQSEPKDASHKWRRIYYGVEDCTGEPWRLERCPFCSMPLPENPLQTCDPYNGRDIELELGILPAPKRLSKGEMDVTGGESD